MIGTWDLMENLNEYVHARDMDTAELIFMNRKARERYGIASMADLEGKKCHEVIHRSRCRCPDCDPDGLEPCQYRVREEYDTQLASEVVIEETMFVADGRRIRLEIAAALSEKRYAERLLNAEAVANRILDDALSETDPDKTLNILMQRLGGLFRGERAYIFERNPDGTSSNTYEWVAEGVTPEMENLQKVPPSVTKTWYDTFAAGCDITIEDVEKIRDTSPAVYETLKPQNIRSLVVVPLRRKEEVIGFFGVANPPSGRLDYALDMLAVMGHFIVSLMEKRDLVKRLDRLSRMDPLTRFGNRFALDVFMRDEMPLCGGMGVVYCDAVGLKRINDRLGHEAGDDYLVRIADALREAFPLCRHFRVGGDEFLILCPGMDGAQAEERLLRLKTELRNREAELSVGFVRREATENLRDCINRAEVLMYKDKSMYYKVTGSYRWGDP